MNIIFSCIVLVLCIILFTVLFETHKTNYNEYSLYEYSNTYYWITFFLSILTVLIFLQLLIIIKLIFSI